MVRVPRSLREVLDQSGDLARRFEEHVPGRVRDAAPLREIRDAVFERSAAERNLADAVVRARAAGVSWAAIGGMLGTSGEAARKRYGTYAQTA